MGLHKNDDMEKWNDIKKKAEKKRTGVGISITHAYEKVRDWMKPDKSQHVILQVIIFIMKLPVLIAVMALSPIFLILMAIAFLAAL